MEDVCDMMENHYDPADIETPDCDAFDHIGVAEVGMALHLAETLGEKDNDTFTEEDDEILSILAREDAEKEGIEVEMVDPRSNSKDKVEALPFEAHVMNLCGIKSS